MNIKIWLRFGLVILLLGLFLAGTSDPEGSSGPQCPWSKKDEETITGSSIPLPSAVSNLTAEAISSSQINLSWNDNSNNEDGVEIERKTDAVTYTKIATVGANVTIYSDTGLTPVTTFYYRIRAYNVNGYSMYSNEVSVPTLSAFLNVVAVAAGGSRSFALTTDGTLWAWGYNAGGQLGLGYKGGNHYSPTRVVTDTDWTQVACGGGHTIARKTDGTLWAWGNNGGWGQLGLGDNIERDAPNRIGTDTDWTEVACGTIYTIARKSDGTLWAWGDNTYGQLGLGDKPSDRLIPTKVGTDTDWAEVACGSTFAHTIARKTDGTLWAWGYNAAGQLGLGDTNERLVPTRIVSDTDWAEVACGEMNTIARKTDGTLWAWGANGHGELGLGDTDIRLTPTRVGIGTNWAEVACGRYHTIARKSDGTLWAWGDNRDGQLGLGDSGPGTDRTEPTKIGTDENWVQVACGEYYTIALKADGTVWTWGNNDAGCLGLGDSLIIRTTPTQVPEP